MKRIMSALLCLTMAFIVTIGNCTLKASAAAIDFSNIDKNQFSIGEIDRITLSGSGIDSAELYINGKKAAAGGTELEYEEDFCAGHYLAEAIGYANGLAVVSSEKEFDVVQPGEITEDKKMTITEEDMSGFADNTPPAGSGWSLNTSGDEMGMRALNEYDGKESGDSVIEFYRTDISKPTQNGSIPYLALMVRNPNAINASTKVLHNGFDVYTQNEKTYFIAGGQMNSWQGFSPSDAAFMWMQNGIMTLYDTEIPYTPGKWYRVDSYFYGMTNNIMFTVTDKASGEQTVVNTKGTLRGGGGVFTGICTASYGIKKQATYSDTDEARACIDNIVLEVLNLKEYPSLQTAEAKVGTNKIIYNLTAGIDSIANDDVKLYENGREAAIRSADVSNNVLTVTAEAPITDGAVYSVELKEGLTTNGAENGRMKFAVRAPSDEISVRGAYYSDDASKLSMHLINSGSECELKAVTNVYDESGILNNTVINDVSVPSGESFAHITNIPQGKGAKTFLLKTLADGAVFKTEQIYGSVPSHAAAGSAEGYAVTYKNSEKSVLIKGRLKNSERKLLTVSFVEFANKDKILSNEDISLLTTIAADENGFFEEKIFLPESFKGGKYVVSMADGEEKLSASFIFINDDEAEKVVSIINDRIAVPDEEKMKELIEQQADIVGIESELVEKYGDYAAEYIIAKRNKKAFSDVQALTDAFNEACAIVAVKNGELDSVMIKYASLFEIYNGSVLTISGYDYYKNLSENERNALAAGFEKTDFKNGDFADLFIRLCVYTRISNAENYLVCKNTILDEGNNGVNNINALIGADMASYDKLSSTRKDSVFTKLYSDKSEISGFSDIAPMFDKCVNYYKNSGGSSGSGKSGGTSSGKISVKPVNPQNPETKKTFSDIKSHWAKNYIEIMCEKGIIRGFEDGSFRPENNVSRAEFAAMCANAFKLKAGKEKRFSDINGDEWFCSVVEKAAAAGLFNGDDQNNFRPNDSITRQDAAVVIYNYIGNARLGHNSDVSFADLDEAAEYAKAPIKALAGAELISGTGKQKYQPAGTLTRAQAVVLISNVCDYLQ